MRHPVQDNFGLGSNGKSGTFREDERWGPQSKYHFLQHIALNYFFSATLRGCNFLALFFDKISRDSETMPGVSFLSLLFSFNFVVLT